ncbi:MAG: DUF1275 domain-containing protein [Chloroflexi bacterium]|nr:MAG: DUF1275 domain-containing protein [Chloroflexota bacterium]
MRDVLLLALTAAAGWIDALSYTALGHVFTANMTGNLVLLGLALGNLQAAGTARSAVALAAFAVGALLGSALTRDAAGEWPGRVTAALGIEAAALIAFAALWHVGGGLEVLIALAAAGMGIQSAAVRRLAVAGVTTTFVTGTLTSLMAGLAALRPTGGAALQAAVLGALLAGATAGAAMSVRAPGAAAAGPAVLVTAVTAAALARRLSRIPPNSR